MNDLNLAANNPLPPGKLLFILSKTDQLNAKDSLDNVQKTSHHRLYKIKLQAQKTYVIVMASEELDSFLRLEDSDGKQLAIDNDSGGDFNAHIVFTAPRDDEYRILATSFVPAQTGSFTLTVQEVIPNP